MIESVMSMLVLCFMSQSTPVRSSQPSQDTDSAYVAAYEKWSSAVESNPSLGEPFWLRTDIGPPTMRSAANEILSFGPNMTPFLVTKLRNETNPLRIYRLLRLLNVVAGINLYYESGVENFYEAAPELRNRFIADWDSQKYFSANDRLQSVWRSNEESPAKKIDPKKLAPIRRFGVFALPFIIDNVESRDSRELFAAFLIITGKSDVYAQYIDNPSRLFVGRNEKLALIKSWVRKNEKKFDRLEGLHQRIKAFANSSN